MAITALKTSWLGIDLDTGVLYFYDARTNRYRAFSEAAGYFAAEDFTGANILTELLTADGSGSGLDADQLDGQDSGYYTNITARLGYTPFNAAGGTISGNTSITGTITGSSTFTLDGLEMSVSAGDLYLDSTGKVWTSDNDGSGSGLDADQLDGQDSGYYTNIPARLGYTPVNLAGGTMTGTLGVPQVDVGTTALTGDGTELYIDGSLAQTAANLPVGLFKSQQAFITSGTWSRPSGIRKILVFCWGGGGGGGGAGGGASKGAEGGGGGGGGFGWKLIDVSAISSVTVTIGAAGAAGADTGGDGGTGGTSSFGTHISAAGGTGGTGMTADTYAKIVSGGSGGTASDGDFNVTGSPGAPATRLDYQNGIAGRGAPSAWLGGGGNGYAGNTAGQAGYARGDGGGGGVVSDSATGRAGGAGGTGMIWVWEFA